MRSFFPPVLQGQKLFGIKYPPQLLPVIDIGGNDDHVFTGMGAVIVIGQVFPVVFNEMGIVTAFDEILAIHDSFKVLNRCFHSGDFILIQSPFHPFYGFVPCIAPNNQF